MQVTLDTRHPLLFCRCDAAQTVRVLVNLLDNACRHAPEGTTIAFGVRRDGANVEFTVADRGPGLPLRVRQRLFEPYTRGDSAGASGTGLGLSIARGLATAQGGALQWAPREGGGSVFALRLPVVEVEVEGIA